MGDAPLHVKLSLNPCLLYLNPLRPALHLLSYPPQALE